MILTNEALQEKISFNSGRNYPLAPESSVIPFPILVDAEISVPYSVLSQDGKSNYTIYISLLELTTNDLKITISAYNNISHEYTVVGTAYSTYEQMADNTTLGIPIAPSNTSLGISGFIYLGDVNTIMSLGVQYYSLTPAQSKFDISCIHPYPDGFTGFIVNGERITGDITLVAGDGVDIIVDGNTLTFKASSDWDTDAILTKDELLEAIANKYGAPITTINDIPADASGNFIIAADDKGCSTITNLPRGISIANPCATTCCDKSYLDILKTNLDNVNTKAGRLTEYLTSVSTNLNALLNEIAMLKLSVNQQ